MAKDGIDMKLIGWEEVARMCKRVGDNVTQKVLPKAVQAASKPVVSEARKNLASVGAVETGALKASIGVKTKSYKRRHSAWAFIGARINYPSKRVEERGETRIPANYAHLVELGTSHSKAKPFMRPAMDERAGEAAEAMRRKLAIEIPKEARKAAKGKR